MKYTTCDNETLKILLLDRDDVLQSAIEESDLDDIQLKKIKKYKQLEEWQKDVLYLCSIMPAQKVADLYCVSKTHIYNTLKKIESLIAIQ